KPRDSQIGYHFASMAWGSKVLASSMGAGRVVRSVAKPMDYSGRTACIRWRQRREMQEMGSETNFSRSAEEIVSDPNWRISGGDEFQREAVVAIAQASGLGPVVEHMALMTAAACAVIFGARHDQLVVGHFVDAARDHVIEARPPRPTVVFGLRIEQR